MTNELTSYASPAGVMAQIALLPAAARNDFNFWRIRLEPLLIRARKPGGKKGIGAELAAIAVNTGTPKKTVIDKFYKARTGGLLALVDRRLAGPRWWNTNNQVRISDADESAFKTYCENNQVSTRAAAKRMRNDWRLGRIKTETPVDPATGFPRGWSIDNLSKNYAPTKFELKSVRIGRGAAASERPLVYATRKGLYVGSHYMFDDMWHNLAVASLAERQVGRPLELFSHDVFSARKMQWGIRVRTKKDDGSHHGLTRKMTRMIVAATFCLNGYNPRGTVCVTEKGAAGFDDELKQILHDFSDGAIRCPSGGMQDGVTHAGMYGAIGGGNPRVKASLEASNHLVQNTFAHLPAQTGRNRQTAPEQLADLQRNAENLVAAFGQLVDAGEIERAKELQFPCLTLAQFMQVAGELYREIESDTDHDLEGWHECGHVKTQFMIGGNWIDQAALIRDPAGAQLAMAMVNAGTLAHRTVKLSRGDVYRAGAGELRQFNGDAACAILGDDLAVERTVRGNRFEFEDREVGPGIHRYFAIAFTPHGEALQLRDREKYQTFVNPFAPDRLFVRRANGSYVGECKRDSKPCFGDYEAMARKCGEVAAIESQLLKPVRERHLAEIRQKKTRHETNVRVLGGKPVTVADQIHDAQTRERLRRERGSLADLTPGDETSEPADIAADRSAQDSDNFGQHGDGIALLTDSETTQTQKGTSDNDQNNSSYFAD